MINETNPSPRLQMMVLDCPDAVELGRFYAELLGWKSVADDDTWVTLIPPGGVVGPDNRDGGVGLGLQQISDYVAPTWPGGAHPQQLHLDLWVPDIDAAEPAVLAAGARLHEHQPATDGGFRVYVDPAGHPFCLVT
ncbi:VOC family protein [Propionibacteriaceae bacterium Y2011]